MNLIIPPPIIIGIMLAPVSLPIPSLPFTNKFGTYIPVFHTSYYPKPLYLVMFPIAVITLKPYGQLTCTP